MRVRRLALQNPVLVRVLEVLDDEGLEGALITSGCVFQSVWNALSGNEPMFGIGDIDVFTYDEDLSAEREEQVARRVQARLPDLEVEVVNQARVHLWYPEVFGHPYAPLSSAVEGLQRFLSPTCAVGLRNGLDGIELVAPFGEGSLTDLLALHIRPNPHAVGREHYERKVAKWSGRWPITAEPWPEGRP